MTTLSGKDDAHGIAIAFGAIRAGLVGLSQFTSHAANGVDDISAAIKNLTHWTATGSGAVAKFFKGDNAAATGTKGGQGLMSRFGIPEGGIITVRRRSCRTRALASLREGLKTDRTESLNAVQRPRIGRPELPGGVTVVRATHRQVGRAARRSRHDSPAGGQQPHPGAA